MLAARKVLHNPTGSGVTLVGPGSGTITGGGNGAWTLLSPSETKTRDLIIVVASSGHGTAGLQSPLGTDYGTALPGTPLQSEFNISNITTLQGWYAFATSDGSTNYFINNTGNDTAAAIAIWRGVNTSDPFGTPETGTDNTGPTSFAGPSATCPAGGLIVGLWAVGTWDSWSGSPTPSLILPSSSITTALNDTNFGASSNAGTSGCGFSQLSASGALGTGEVDPAQLWAAIAIPLNPA